MRIELQKIKIKDLFDGYINNAEEGVKGYHGKLNIRPAYQREFIYKPKQRDAVIDTVLKGFPLNTMYWVKNEDGTYELLDGQQRTISICQFINGDFSIKHDGNTKYFSTFLKEIQDQILDYDLMVYICEGTDTEKLDWFRTINIAGERLTDQELLNVNYMGPWLTDAKRIFSKTNCAAYNLGKDYVKGKADRQEILETALDWISGSHIDTYMRDHQHEPTATELWIYFQTVISWVKAAFPNYRSEMNGIQWGHLYNKYHGNTINPIVYEEKVSSLMANTEVTNKKGIYEYVLSGESEDLACKLSTRTFSDADKRSVYERQGGICPLCGEHHDFKDMEGDHRTPWWRGGTTTLDNLQMVCKKCNGKKSGKTLKTT